MNVTILGCGAYGMALACMFRENNCNMKMWDKFDDVVNKLKKEYTDIYFTTDLSDSLDGSDLVVIAIPVTFLENVVIELKKYYDNQDILIASKGISVKDGNLASQIVKKHINTNNIGAISGGTFAIDMMKKNVMGLTVGTNSDSVKDKVKNSLENKYLKVQYTSDILGIQICGAVKNVIAIGFGILDGAGYPESSRFLFLTEAIYEINYFINKLGGSDKTVMSYAGIDDIVMTCTSSKSRNYTFGSLIGKNSSNEEIEKYKCSNTIEGFGTAMGIRNLCKRENINLEICDIIYEILYKNVKYNKLIEYLENK